MNSMPYYGDTPDESPVSVRDENDDRLGFAIDAEDEAEACDPSDHGLRGELWTDARLKWERFDPLTRSDKNLRSSRIQHCRLMERLAESSWLLEILS